MGKNEDQTCLICGSKSRIIRRGLCDAHYQKFNRHLKRLEKEDQQAFEDELIKKGMLLPKAKTGRKPHHEDPFAVIAEKYRKTIDVETIEIAAEVKSKYSARKKGDSPPKKSKKKGTK